MKRLGIVAIAFAIFVSACQSGESDPSPTGESDPSPTGETGTGGTVTIALGSFLVENLNPVYATQTDKPYYSGLYDYLIGVTEDGELDPESGVLEEWSSANEGMVWTLTLRPGVTWHDGTEMTSEDVKFTLEVYTTEDSICSSCSLLKSSLDRVEVVDEQTVEVHLNTPLPRFDRALTPINDDIAVLPKAYYEEVGAEGFSAAPIGSGPFRFGEHDFGESITLEANSDYWNQDRVPGFQTVRFVLVPDATSRLALVQTGEADVAEMDPLLAGDAAESGIRLMGPQQGQTLYVAFGHSYREDFNTNQLAMRKAVALAIDMDAVLAAVYPEGIAERASSFTPTPLREGYIPDLEPYPHDMAEAQRLIREAGLEGSEITLYQFTQAGMLEAPTLFEAMAGYLEEAGLAPILVPIDYPVLRPQLFEDNIDEPYLHILFAQSGAEIDRLNRTFFMSHESGGLLATYHDPEEMDALALELAGTADLEAREELAQEVVRTVYDTYGILPIATVNSAWAVGPRVQDWRPTNNTFGDLRWESLTPGD